MYLRTNQATQLSHLQMTSYIYCVHQCARSRLSSRLTLVPLSFSLQFSICFPYSDIVYVPETCRCLGLTKVMESKGHGNKENPHSGRKLCQETQFFLQWISTWNRYWSLILLSYLSLPSLPCQNSEHSFCIVSGWRRVDLPKAFLRVYNQSGWSLGVMNRVCWLMRGENRWVPFLSTPAGTNIIMTSPVPDKEIQPLSSPIPTLVCSASNLKPVMAAGFA